MGNCIVEKGGIITMLVYLKIIKGTNNTIHYSIYKHTVELFKYKYIEDGNTFTNEYNKCNAIVQLFPCDKKSNHFQNWYTINNYQSGFITKLVKYYNDSVDPYAYVIEEIENMTKNNQWDRMEIIKI